jgi:uncharacterized protein DUF955
MMPVDYRRRKSRGGKGLIPPNPSQWEIEHHALDVREAAGVDLHAHLPIKEVFGLVPYAHVVPHGALPAAQSLIDHFRGAGKRAWSGLALPLGGGQVAVVYNDSHAETRTRATLMEEFFHLWLGHPPTTVRVYNGHGNHRTHNAAVESEAYGCGAATLVPYKALRAAIDNSQTLPEIADHFGVSSQLVEFRAKVTKQYSKLRRRRPRRRRK